MLEHFIAYFLNIHTIGIPSEGVSLAVMTITQDKTKIPEKS